MSEVHSNSEQTHDLLERVRRGDWSAFDELFAHFYGYLHRVIELRLDPRLRARLDPSDEVQETQPRLQRDLGRWRQDITDMLASQARWQLVISFNEWPEGTSVESAQEWATPSGYGAYLDALHELLP